MDKRSGSSIIISRGISAKAREHWDGAEFVFIVQFLNVLAATTIYVAISFVNVIICIHIYLFRIDRCQCIVLVAFFVCSDQVAQKFAKIKQRFF